MLKICGIDGCCGTPNLRNDHVNFRQGQEDIFYGDRIGECDGHELGMATSSEDFGMVLFHSLENEGKLDWISVHTTSGFYKCWFSQMLHFQETESGASCVFIKT